MGDIADAMINGDLCQVCGQYMDSGGDGYPVTCAECGGATDKDHYNQGQGKNNKHWRKILRDDAPVQLEKAGIAFTLHNNGAHIVIKTRSGFIDFWPGQQRWKRRGGKHGGGCITELIRRVKESMKGHERVEQ